MNRKCNRFGSYNFGNCHIHSDAIKDFYLIVNPVTAKLKWTIGGELELIVQVHHYLKNRVSKSQQSQENITYLELLSIIIWKKFLKEACRWLNELRTRKKKLDPYKEHILAWLKEHPDLSASQVSDWLCGPAL